MKKMLSLLLTLCLLFGALPTQALAYVGDILPAGSATVEQVTLDDGSLSLQNKYIHVTLRKLWGSYAYITVVPAAKTDEESMWVSQTPYCNFITYDHGKEQTEGVVLNPERVEFVTGTPNDPTTKAIKVEYSLLTAINLVTAKAIVYYELVQLKENEASSNDTWGVLASVSKILIDEESLPKDWNRDFAFKWGYAINNFTATGHVSNLEKRGGPAIKMSRTTVPHVGEGESLTITTENSVFTAPVEELNTKTVPKGHSSWGDVDGVYITEVYTDGYPWANPFVGLSDYYEKEITSSDGSPIRVALAQTVSVRPGDMPLNTYVMCESYAGFDLIEKNETPSQEQVSTDFRHYLWGFHDLMKAGEESVPSEPDKVDPSIYAKRLAAFASGGGVTVEYVADDAALETLKKQYGNPVAIINGDYESQNGTEFTFTGGAALLSPSVTATWGSDGSLVIKKDGTIEQRGVSLNAPTFKFYQPKSGEENDLTITLTTDGFAFEITPEKNDAIVFVDIPYATVKLEQATADAAGNLVFTGNIGFQTLFSGAEFSMEKLGYGLTEKTVNGKKTYEFKVNGVHAKGKFDTEKLMTLELAKIEGEVNTFKGEERYAFELELNVFDLFETEASLALERSKKDGSLIPDELWFYVKADPGIPLIPPIPIGQLNGGGAGFKDLAATVNGDYFAIPPLKLRGALTGTYLHLIQGTGNVVLGPSEISLKATDVGLVGVGKAGQVIDSFGYSLQLSGQERSYRGTNYKGIYFVGSEELKLNLPNNTINAIVLDSSVKLGAFGGVNDAKNRVYLGVGANGTVRGRVQIPTNIRYLGGLGVDVANINLIIGGQTTFQIHDISVSEGMKQAFNNVDIYLGAMAQVGGWLASARVWVLVPQIVETNFRMGGGWDIEVMAFGYMSEWDWSEKGVEPVVQAMSPEDGEENTVALLAAEPLTLENGGVNSTEITVDAGTGETPYILLAFDKSVTEDEVKQSLSVTKKDASTPTNIYWVGDDCRINSAYQINADTDLIKNKDDGTEYRVALLRLTEGGTYQVNTGSLELVTEKSKGFAVTPYEKLELTLSSNQVSGRIKYAEENTKYVLRTYFAKEQGGADYLIDERDVNGSESISVSIPTEGTLAPTGDYYVTSFLMTEKAFNMEDGTTKTALAAIDNKQFDTTISYTNINQPSAPTNVNLEFVGNEVMTATWGEVEGASGYAVTIYQQDGNDWVDTGFGYDLDKNTTFINMALTVGGEETEESKNLSADKIYKVGVRAYKLVSTGLEEVARTAGENAVNPNKAFKGAKYYSAEKQSDGKLLPKYTPLTMTLKVNETTCVADENGVYHAYVDGTDDALTVSCDTEGVTYKVTRMDRTTGNEIQPDANGAYSIPDFTGTLMLRVDGVKGKDKTSVFLLVSMDKTPPVLTLSDPIFFADKATGEYTVTGTADAGSKIVYGDNESVYAASDGSFAIPGTLESNSGILSLYAQDSAGNASAPQLALITKQTKHSATVSGGSASTYLVSTPDKTENGTVTVTPRYAERGDTVTITVKPDDGFKLGKLTVTDKNGNELILTDKGDGKYTFTMPSGRVEVKATFVEDIKISPFGDVATNAYYYEAVKWAQEKGITDGIGNNLFGPNLACTRAQIVTFLWRAAGSPEPKGDAAGMTDVAVGSYYEKAVAWAIENGITTGTGGGKFSPDDTCTRAQAVTFLARALDAKASGRAEFSDIPTNSYYADAVAWAAANGVTTGIGNSLFGPNDDCTRAQIVTFLYRAYNK